MPLVEVRTTLPLIEYSIVFVLSGVSVTYKPLHNLYIRLPRIITRKEVWFTELENLICNSQGITEMIIFVHL